MKPHKDITNLEIAELLRAVAAAYQLKDADKNKFRIIAYERAADAIERLSSEAKDIWDEGKLDDIPGVGTSISEHLDEIFRTGTSKHFDSLMKGLPPAMFELMKLPKVGPKTAYKLSKTLGITEVKGAMAKLQKAIAEQKVASIEGFGEESQAAIKKAIEETKDNPRRMLLPYAETIAEAIVTWLKGAPSVLRADPLGSLRRRASTVGDIDIAIATKQPQDALERFCRYPKAKRILEKGKHTASVILPGEIQVDVMVQEPESYGALLQHFTGSKHHNIALREYALKKGFSLSEYGIKKTKSIKETMKSFSSEEDFYGYLSLDYIPPELREDTGEIEAAKEKRLPSLVEVQDIKCDLQIHSDFDVETSHDLGESSMEEIVKRGGELGYQYMAFTEHNPSRSKHTDEQIISLLKKKKKAIDKLNYSITHKNTSSVKNVKVGVKKVFNSLEIDILPDGRLAVPDKALEVLDFALVSIHSVFDQEKTISTKRVLQALNFPRVKIFAHPTGRELGRREGMELDWPKIFSFCKQRDIWIEINCDPIRLDLPDFLVHEAIKSGIKLTLGTDAHHKDALNNMKWGVYAARRGWATKRDIINCLSLEDFEKVI